MATRTKTTQTAKVETPVTTSPTTKTAAPVPTNGKGRPVSVLNKTEMNKVVHGLTTWSSKIRALDSKGYTRSEIARFLGKQYQHVRNVLITPLASDQK